MGILFTHHKLLSIHSESAPRSGSKASTYNYAEKEKNLEISTIVRKGLIIKHANFQCKDEVFLKIFQNSWGPYEPQTTYTLCSQVGFFKKEARRGQHH